MSKAEMWTVEKLSCFFHDMVSTDRQGLLAVSGETGVGKSTFLSQVSSKYGDVNGVGWSFDNMTWSRDEMMTWIDGDKDSVPDPVTGLKPNQLPEKSVILADELLPMFYSENRFEEDQQKAIATLNMCRDRHLLICGAVPSFWDLTGKFRGRATYYAYIPERGVVWVFRKENNPFAKDPWNTQLNEKVFRKFPNQPWKSPNYICTVKYDDWEGSLREQYYTIRNKKRLVSLNAMDKKKEKKEKVHKKSVLAFGILVNHLTAVEGWSHKKITEVTHTTATNVSRWSSYALENYEKYQDSV